MADEELEQTPAQDEIQDDAPGIDEAATDTEDTATSTPPADSAAGANGVQKRISELTRNWRTTERDRDYWRELALGKQQEPAKPEPQGRPKVDDFEDYEAYVEALTDFKVNQRAESMQAENRKQQEQQAQTQRQQQFQTRVTEFSQEHPDFWEVAGNPSVPISQPIVDAAMESDMGPQVLYHLGQHPDEAAKLSGLSPVAVAREVGRLEARLQLPPQPKASQAPDPIEPVGGGGETATKDPEKMSMDEFMAWRRQQTNQ